MTWPPGSHASTFGGNPVAIAAALTTIELLETQYVAQAARVGEYLMERLKDWPQRHRLVGEVRGKGLMIGIELVKDQRTKEHAVEERDRWIELCFERGLLVLGCGASTLRLMPPLSIDEQDAGVALEILDRSLAEIERAGAPKRTTVPTGS